MNFICNKVYIYGELKVCMVKGGIIVALVIGIFMLSAVSAEIFISQPNTVYNLGDEFNLSISISPSESTNGFFVAKLVCGASEVDISRNYLSVNAKQQKTQSISLVIGNELIGDAGGECFVNVLYGKEEADSQHFEIARSMEVILSVPGTQYEPGKIVNLDGRAIKSNGALVNGFVDLGIVALNVNLTGVVNSGVFNFNITVPVNAAPGNYDVEARVYEKLNELKSNEGYAKSTLKVKQVIKKANITLSNKEIVPENDLTYTPMLFDQAGSSVNEQEMVLTVYTPSGEVFSKDLVKSGKERKLGIEFNYTAGNWKIEAKRGETVSEESFVVLELQRASFSMINGTLIIINTGNVPYSKPLKIIIGNDSEIRDITIRANDVKAFKLNAVEEGQYNVKIDEGNSTVDFGSTMLTANAINLGDINNALFKSAYSPVIWIAFVIIIALVIFYYYRKNKQYSYSEKSRVVQTNNVIGGPIRVDSAIKNQGSARSMSLIQEGTKEECSLIALKIRNMNEIQKSDSNAKDIINRALTIAKEAKAKVYVDGDYRIIIIAGKMRDENNLKAVSIAKAMDDLLTENNKRFAHKIDYGIGVHSGELIVERKVNDFRFNSLGNTIPITKRAAEKAKAEVYLTENMQRKVMANVRSEKNREENLWKLHSLRTREQHSKFIDKFMNRNIDQFRK